MNNQLFLWLKWILWYYNVKFLDNRLAQGNISDGNQNFILLIVGGSCKLSDHPLLGGIVKNRWLIECWPYQCNLMVNAVITSIIIYVYIYMLNMIKANTYNVCCGDTPNMFFSSCGYNGNIKCFWPRTVWGV